MKKLTNFLLGVSCGVGIGLLIAPSKGEVTRKKVKAKIDDITVYLKNMDSDTLRSDCLVKLNNIKNYLEELDNAKIKDDVSVVSKKIKKEIKELKDKTVKAASPYLDKAIEDLRSNTLVLLNKVLVKLEI